MDLKRNRMTESALQRYFCFRNFKKYLLETTLHGLRFVGDDHLTIWERLFFLCAFIAAVSTTAHLIGYIYAKWVSTPVIIGIDPFPISISSIPFPAVTLCNMNQILRSKVRKYNETSPERAMIDMACSLEPLEKEEEMPDYYKHNNLSLATFLVEHAQPCSRLLKSCEFSSIKRTCSDLFREIVTDEGLCCVFNLLPTRFRYEKDFTVVREYTNTEGSVAVPWTPEAGYPKELPEKYYPRTASGIGVSMGLSVVLDAEVDEYFCSSTNSAGFKISLQSPIEAPRVRDISAIVGVGDEVRLRIDPNSAAAAPTIRSIEPNSRLCLFSDEGKQLTVYKYYTRRNCENECQARYLYRKCHCIPYNLPKVFSNSSICGALDFFCQNNAQIKWLRSKFGPCRSKCYSSCFDLKFGSSTFSAPLAEGYYILQDDDILKNISRQYMRQNIAVIHFFYSEFIFHGTVRNVYIGFTEFLSNTGGILGLFLGFSFISLAEAFYYAFIRPIFWWKRPVSKKATVAKLPTIKTKSSKFPWNAGSTRLGQRIFKQKRDFIPRASPTAAYPNEP